MSSDSLQRQLTSGARASRQQAHMLFDEKSAVIDTRLNSQVCCPVRCTVGPAATNDLFAPDRAIRKFSLYIHYIANTYSVVDGRKNALAAYMRDIRSLWYIYQSRQFDFVNLLRCVAAHPSMFTKSSACLVIVGCLRILPGRSHKHTNAYVCRATKPDIFSVFCCLFCVECTMVLAAVSQNRRSAAGFLVQPEACTDVQPFCYLHGVRKWG